MLTLSFPKSPLPLESLHVTACISLSFHASARTGQFSSDCTTQSTSIESRQRICIGKEGMTISVTNLICHIKNNSKQGNCFQQLYHEVMEAAAHRLFLCSHLLYLCGNLVNSKLCKIGPSKQFEINKGAIAPWTDTRSGSWAYKTAYCTGKICTKELQVCHPTHVFYHFAPVGPLRC